METVLMRWESATRYYVVRVERDLLGDVTLLRAWGGRGSRRGNSLIDCVPDDQIDRALQRLAATRCRHGYTLVRDRADHRAF